MPFQKGVQVEIHGRMHGSKTVNVLNFGADAPFVVDNYPEDLTDLLTRVLDCVVQSLLPGVTQDWTCEFVKGKFISPQVTDELTIQANVGSTGQLGPASASFEATLMDIRTGGGGKSGRGRNFLPPPGEAATAQSTIDGPTLILLSQFLLCMTQKFVGPNSSSIWKLGVFSRKIFGGIFANFNQAFRPAVTLTVSPILSIMGSRKLGRGA
jgi:hypothetical protein